MRDHNISKRIKHILDVLDEIYLHYRPGDSVSRVSDLRLEAAKEIASNDPEAKFRAVQDKYQRQLEPDIKGTDDFDSAVEHWLSGKSLELKDVLLKHISKNSGKADQERRLISRFFEERKPKTKGNNEYAGKDSKEEKSPYSIERSPRPSPVVFPKKTRLNPAENENDKFSETFDNSRVLSNTPILNMLSEMVVILDDEISRLKYKTIQSFETRELDVAEDVVLISKSIQEFQQDIIELKERWMSISQNFSSKDIN